MAYKTADLEKKALAAIKKHNLYFIEDVVAYLPCDKVTFYNHKLNEFNTIKDALEANRISTKVKMRKNWQQADSAALQMGLYKLIGTDAEAHRLNGSKQEIDHTSKGEKIEGFTYVVPKPENEAKNNTDK